ncbi:hypothetical protein NQ317_013270 [Molorchus minor]|uniref:Tyr recombinase domain-containing protein n=1 Tax=Molorchus minor TaxID=1323400 RepID=A0ABQ9ISR2_9CUCU|nr:hypothetical protein NQ317_013270 [Molorchus minor]
MCDLHSDFDDIPSDIEEAAINAVCSLIPYDLGYEKFEKWREEKKVKHVNEKVLLAYFEGKKNLKASTLWTHCSMLRTELSLKKGIDIKTYNSLIAFLKRQSNGYHAKKSSFLTEVDDNNFLLAKVVLVVGIAGACRKSQLTFLRVEDVTDMRRRMFVIREFVITPGDIEEVNFVDIIRKYRNLRPKNNKHNRFFVRDRNYTGVQSVGINIIDQR